MSQLRAFATHDGVWLARLPSGQVVSGSTETEAVANARRLQTGRAL